jgi:hypothetical protein
VAVQDDIDGSGLRNWLNNMSLGEWRTRFGATPADLADLLEYCRPRGSSVLRTLLTEGTVTIPVQLAPTDSDDEASSTASPGNTAELQGESAQQLVLRRQRGSQRPSPIAIYSGTSISSPVAVISTSLHNEVESILDTGLAHDVDLSGDQLTLRLED